MRFLCLTMFVACIPASVSASAPHPFHTSMAEVEYNPATGRLEVALKLYAIDAEAALSKLNGKACSLDDEATRDRLMKRYMLAKLRVERPSARKTKREPGLSVASQSPTKPKFNYVGSELSNADVWVYFELEVPGGNGDFTLKNDVLTEIQREQLNIVRYRGPAGAQTLYFNARRKSCVLSLSRKVPQPPASNR